MQNVRYIRNTIESIKSKIIWRIWKYSSERPKEWCHFPFPMTAPNATKALVWGRHYVQIQKDLRHSRHRARRTVISRLHWWRLRRFVLSRNVNLSGVEKVADSDASLEKGEVMVPIKNKEINVWLNACEQSRLYTPLPNKSAQFAKV